MERISAIVLSNNSEFSQETRLLNLIGIVNGLSFSHFPGYYSFDANIIMTGLKTEKSYLLKVRMMDADQNVVLKKNLVMESKLNTKKKEGHAVVTVTISQQEFKAPGEYIFKVELLEKNDTPIPVNSSEIIVPVEEREV